MSHINRTEGIFRGLRIHNKDNNILEMNQSGNYKLSSKNISNYSSNGISNISEKNSVYKSKNDILLGSDNGNIVIRNGSDNLNPLFNYSNSFSSGEEPLILKSENDITKIRNESLLIESLDTKKGLCLLSNKGINQISHGNINTISDSDIYIQSNKNINLNSYDNIILNSERIVSTVEDDIILISSHGELKLGGDGINQIGLKVNSNQNKNYVGLGNINDYAKRNLHIDIKDNLDQTNKNGILITSEDKNNIYPDISLKNLNNGNLITDLSIGVGDYFKNNVHFAKKIKKNGETYLQFFDNYQFSLNDINKEIVYEDINIKNDTIKSLTNENNLVLLNDNTSDIDIENFSYQKCYIKNTNNAHLKTITSSDLNIGVNNSNTINIKNNNNVGINSNNPSASLEISNKVGGLTNIRLDKNKKYLYPKAVQMKNGNCILFCNTERNSLHNLEAFIYSDCNFITSFIIYENSQSFIDFDVDNLNNKNDHFGVAFNFYNGMSYYTQINIYDSNGYLIKEGYKFSHIYLETNSSPKIKSFSLDLNNKVKKSGYLLAIRDMTIEGNIICKLLIFEDYENESVNVIDMEEKVNSFIEDNLDLNNNGKIIGEINHKYISLNFNENYQSFILTISCNTIIKSNLNNTEEVIYSTLLNEIFIDIDNLMLTKTIELNTNNINQFILAKNKKINDKFINMTSDYQITQCDTSLINKRSGLFKICYYLRDTHKNKIVNLIIETFKSNNSNNDKFLDFKVIDNLDLSSLDIYPSISYKKNNEFIIVYQVDTNLKYYLSKEDEIIDFDINDLQNPYLLKLNDSYGEYLSTLLIFENNNLDNIYNYNSVNFQEISSEGYIFKIKNKNNNISVKNNGNININEQIEINKEQKYTKINNIVINRDDFLPDKAKNGQLAFVDNELYLYVSDEWKKVQLL